MNSGSAEPTQLRYVYCRAWRLGSEISEEARRRFVSDNEDDWAITSVSVVRVE